MVVIIVVEQSGSGSGSPTGTHSNVVVNGEVGREVEHGDDSVSNIAVGGGCRREAKKKYPETGRKRGE